MAGQDEDEPSPPPPAALGEILQRAYADDYHADLRFELISLLLVLAHDPRDGEVRPLCGWGCGRDRDPAS